MSHLFRVTLILLSGLLNVVQADTQLSFQSPNHLYHSEVSISGDKLRIDARTPFSQDTALYFANSGTLTILSAASQQYHSITREELAALLQKFRSMQRQLQSQLQHMAPPQRAFMEYQMQQSGLLGNNVRNQLDLTPSSQTASVQNIECLIYLMGNSGTACSATTDDLGISASEGATLTSLFEFIAQAAPVLPMSSGPSDIQQQLFLSSGRLPIELRSSDGSLQMQLAEVSHQRLNPEVFYIPEGYSANPIHFSVK